MEIIYIISILLLTDIAFLQILGFPLFSMDVTFVIMLVVQLLFVFFYFFLKKKTKKNQITNLLLQNSGNCDVALYDSKGKLLGRKGKFFNKKNPLIELNRKSLDFEYNEPLALSKLQTALLSRSDTVVELAIEGDMQDVVFAKVSVTFFRRSRDLVLWRLHDITSERTISEVFRSELKYLNDFISDLPVGLFLADSGGKIRFANNTMCAWLGKDYKEIEGNKLALFSVNGESPDYSGSWQGAIKLKGANNNNFDAFVRHSSYDNAGETMFRSIIVKDVQQGDISEKAMKESAIRFQWIFDENPVGIAFVDTDYNISEGNDALFRLFHSYREKVIGSSLANYIYEADLKELNEARGLIVTGIEKAANVELRIINNEKQFIGMASVFITPMTGLDYSNNSHTEGLVLHFIDTTERNQLADQFSQAQKMQAMGLMAGGIAHNFNNTLTAIIGFCDLLLQRIGINDPSYQDIKQIKENADRSADLIKDLLSYSRNQPSKAKEINLNSFLADIYNFVKISLTEKVELRTEYSRHVGNIKFDEVKLQQIISNLANNARDAILPNRGHVTLRTKSQKFKQPLTIENDVMPPGKYVVLEIEDSGCGISEDIITKIFDPFFSTKKDSSLSGTGFGLSIAQGDVRQAGGFISVKSAIGIGTKFTIYLPEYDRANVDEDEIIDTRESEIVAISPLSIKARIESDGQMSFGQIQETPAKPMIDTSGNAKILLVEDEDAVRAFGSRALRNKGYVVTDCACAEDALDLIEQGETFDLIASDVVMPGMSGTEMIEEIKKIMPNVKVLLMSGYFADIANVDNYNNYFLPKPFSLEQLTTRIKEIIDEEN